MNRLNPFDKIRRAAEQKTQIERSKVIIANKKKDNKASKKAKQLRRKAFNAIQAGQAVSFEQAEAAFQRIGAEAESSEEESEDEQ